MKSLLNPLLGFIHLVIGSMTLPASATRDERGLSQSTEQAIMIAGAVTIALVIVGFVTTYVQNQLASAGP